MKLMNSQSTSLNEGTPTIGAGVGVNFCLKDCSDLSNKNMKIKLDPSYHLLKLKQSHLIFCYCVKKMSTLYLPIQPSYFFLLQISNSPSTLHVL